MYTYLNYEYNNKIIFLEGIVNNITLKYYCIFNFF